MVSHMESFGSLTKLDVLNKQTSLKSVQKRELILKQLKLSNLKNYSTEDPNSPDHYSSIEERAA